MAAHITLSDLLMRFQSIALQGELGQLPLPAALQTTPFSERRRSISGRITSPPLSGAGLPPPPVHHLPQHQFGISDGFAAFTQGAFCILELNPTGQTLGTLKNFFARPVLWLDKADDDFGKQTGCLRIDDLKVMLREDVMPDLISDNLPFVRRERGPSCERTTLGLTRFGKTLPSNLDDPLNLCMDLRPPIAGRVRIRSGK